MLRRGAPQLSPGGLAAVGAWLTARGARMLQ